MRAIVSSSQRTCISSYICPKRRVESHNITSVESSGLSGCQLLQLLFKAAIDFELLWVLWQIQPKTGQDGFFACRLRKKELAQQGFFH